MKLRLRFISKHPLQLKFLSLILLSILVPTVIAGGCLYYFIFQIMAEQLGIPEAIAFNLVPVVEKINSLLLITMPPLFILFFLLAALVTNRLIGPLARLEDDLQKISEGDYSVRLSLRKDDDLRPIADAVNTIIDKIEKK
jgi:methyl-accepting chemotaxis protein